jgi:hypothetical protein
LHIGQKKRAKNPEQWGAMMEAFTTVRAKEMGFLKDSKACMYHDQPL